MPFQSNLCEEHWAPFATSVTTTVVSAILCLITVPGNLLICWAVIWDPNRNLKTSFNYLVLNIAVADLIVGAVTEPVFVGYHANEALKHQVLGIRWVVYMSYFMTSTASVLSIAALAANRYRAVTSHQIMARASNRSSTNRAVITSVLVWMCSLGLPFLYLVSGFYLLAFIFANTAIVVTVGVLVFVYYGISRSLRQHGKNTEHVLSDRAQERIIQREERVTNSLLLIIISFIIFVAPSCIMIYVINLCHGCSCVMIHWFRDLQYLFVLANSASNQFLYAWRVRSFQRAFQTISGVRWVAKKLRRGRVDLESVPTDTTPDRKDKST